MATQTTLEILQAARERIADRTHWTRGEWARDKWGHGIDVRSPKAVRWCAVGALRVELWERKLWSDGPKFRAAFLLQIGRGIQGVTAANDTQGHDAVLALYDAAIALARSEAVP